jgi:formylmethanofuran dehydrogenase subunit E
MAVENPIELYDKAALFHGHSCPGLALGYRMITEAMAFLNVQRASDEELAAITECDFCGVDALQVVSGCTFGKGNLRILYYGKRSFILFDRAANNSCRVIPVRAEIRIRKEWVEQGRDAWPELIGHFVHGPADEIVIVRACENPNFGKSVIEKMENCECCGEPVVLSKIVQSGSGRLCIPCSKEYINRV